MKRQIMQHRALFVVIALLAASLLLGTLVSAAPIGIETLPNDTPVPISEDGVKYSHRLIVELESPSLAASGLLQQSASNNGPLALSATAEAHVAQLQAEQAAFVQSMQQALPEAEVATYLNEKGESIEATYQILLNAVAIDPGMPVEQARKELAAMPGVKQVYLDYAHEPQLYASLDWINAPALWAQVGGKENAGAGVKVASMDGGLHHEAAMFDGTGWEYPEGWPEGGLGDSTNNNGKIIVSRAYFRPWDPPDVGDENVWPGEDGTSHGTHTGSTAAGNEVVATYLGITRTISGVAPGAWLMSYRMFYDSVTGDGSFYNVEGVAALEDIVRDGADVLNNSWGGGPSSVGGEFDPLDNALINASQAGVFISMSNGNAGPGDGTGDHPSPDYINVAASTDPGLFVAGLLDVTGPEPVGPGLEDFPFGTADFGPEVPGGQTLPYDYLPATVVDPANFEGCNPWTGTPFDGMAALISRGTCQFSQKVYYAQQAGAEFVVIYNSGGREAAFGMAAGAFADQVTISSIGIGQSNGLKMVDWYNLHPGEAELTVNTVAFQAGDTPDLIATFSSRGPGVGNVLKPDIAAPGVSILAQGYGPGPGEARHLGYGQASGTSMASPHVAGTAAILRQIHPTWPNSWIKSALMSTSVYTNIYNQQDGSPAQPLDMGAGRLDLTNVADPGVILDPPSASFGYVLTGTVHTLTVQVTSVAAATESYDLSTLYTGAGFAVTQTMDLPGYTISPASITLDPGETTTIMVIFDADQSMGVGDNQGYLIMEGDNGHHAHMGAWARVTPMKQADVLLIDNDASYTLGFPNYRSYYTEALDELGLSYEVWHADANYNNSTTIPHAAVLSAYDVVLYFSGDNFYPDGTFTVATPLTSLDMNRLVEYANAGGIFIGMGQDATSVMNESFFLEATLGALTLQDSVTGNELPDLPILPYNTDMPGLEPFAGAPPAFDDIVLDLSGPEANVVLLSGTNVTPTVIATGMSGEATFAYNSVSNELDYSIDIEVSQPTTITAAHIHTGTVEMNGGVAFPTMPPNAPVLVTDTLSWAGSVMLTEAQEATLDAEGYYLNIHTNYYPGGEIRGQVSAAFNGDGAANQYYIDELETIPNGDPNPIPGTIYPYRPLLYYPGQEKIEDGVVAVAHRDQPNLDWPGLDFMGRTIFASFGLEGVNNGIPGTTSRAELLHHFLMWAMDEPEVTIDWLDDEYADTSPVEVFEATLTSNITGTTGVAYRWDFGDGTDYSVFFDSELVSHDYEYCGTYTVYVEAIDSWGNRAIGSLEVEITDQCLTPTQGVEATVMPDAQTAEAGAMVTYTIAITNTGNETDTFDIMLDGHVWRVDAPAFVGPLAAGESTTVEVVVHIPAEAALMAEDMVTVTFVSQANPAVSTQVVLTTTVEGYPIYLPLIMKE